MVAFPLAADAFMTQAAFFHLLLCALYLSVLGEAALSKLIARETPTWFVEKYAGTWLGRVPAGLMWWSIAAIELAAAALFAASALSGEYQADVPSTLLYAGLLVSMGIFAALTFGLRVAFDYVGAAQTFAFGAFSAVLFVVLGGAGA